jgi:hypothetical protein
MAQIQVVTLQGVASQKTSTCINEYMIHSSVPVETSHYIIDLKFLANFRIACFV